MRIHFVAHLLAVACLAAGNLCATTIGLTFPSSQWGPGTGDVAAYPEGGALSGPPQCSIGLGSFVNQDECKITVSAFNGGLASGDAIAYKDAAGIHVYDSASTIGSAVSTAESGALFSDTITNNSYMDAEFQIAYHVDGALTVSGNNAFSQLTLAFLGYPATTKTYSLSGPDPFTGATLNINADLLSPVFTIGAGQAVTYYLSMQGYTTESTRYAPVGTGSAVTDALNTLKITGFSATDTFGNPLPTSDFSSADGADYSSLGASPEPASAFLMGGGLLGLACLLRRRNNRGK